MPIKPGFSRRLLPVLDDIAARYGTPFHIYDEAGMIASHRRLVYGFRSIRFKQFFAVKALPNPVILKLLHRAGAGMDCASVIEIRLAQRAGISGDDVMFTSNNTSVAAYRLALEAGTRITLDDICYLREFSPLPDVVSFRVALGGLSTPHMGGDDSKFGVPAADICEAYRLAKSLGARRFGIHHMSCANTLDVDMMLRGALSVIETAAAIGREAGITFEFINIGGGLGIPYRPDENDFDIDRFSAGVISGLRRHFPVLPALFMECGRSISGPHGVLVSRVQTVCKKQRNIMGLDASMSSLMRPALYKDAYHHITLPFNTGPDENDYDVVGSLCENMDKFAVRRRLPTPRPGELVLIHDTGAHGHAMGFNYNGQLRPAELLLTADHEIKPIRRPETFDDYLATVVDQTEY